MESGMKNKPEKDCARAVLVPLKKSLLNNSVKAIDLAESQEKFGYDEKAALEMLALFMKSLPESFANMQVAYQQSDWEKLRFHVHKLHGGAIYCGVPRLQSSAKELELAIEPKGTPDDLNKLYRQLLKEIERLKTEYERFS
jgi:two-component system sensor histidine kinase BarA